MSNDMTIAGGTGIALPDNISDIFGDKKSNIGGGDPTPKLSISGKVWKVIVDGNEKVLTTMVDDEQVPTQTVKVVILNHLASRSRAFFEGTYNDGGGNQPDCWSIHGDKPDPGCPSPQAVSCETCEMSAKGSKMTDDGRETTACSQNRRVVVIPTNDLNFKALLLKLPVTSLWEKEGAEEANGWFAYDSYLKFLKAHGIEFTCMVKTTMKFDSKTPYPKVLFKYNGVLPEDEMRSVAARMDSDEVIKILNNDRGMQPQTSDVVDEEEEVAPPPPPKKAAPKKKAASKKTAKKPAPEPESEPEPAIAEDDNDLDDILSDWS